MLKIVLYTVDVVTVDVVVTAAPPKKKRVLPGRVSLVDRAKEYASLFRQCLAAADKFHGLSGIGGRYLS
jgi:hypothetical protein